MPERKKQDDALVEAIREHARAIERLAAAVERLKPRTLADAVLEGKK